MSLNDVIKMKSSLTVNNVVAKNVSAFIKFVCKSTTPGLNDMMTFDTKLSPILTVWIEMHDTVGNTVSMLWSAPKVQTITWLTWMKKKYNNQQALSKQACK